ncbi:MAG: NAD(+) synthase [Gemmatales bacterium]|nr:MAG: NAD(+) synthase [Gemmatales bacterium]
MSHHGFLRLAAAAPVVRVADCQFNLRHILVYLQRARQEAIDVIVFPELCLTGYTCADLFQQKALLQAALDSLEEVREATASVYAGVAVVGLPIVADDRLFNCAAVLHQGRILGIVPKTVLPNYKEFYEVRWFSSGTMARSKFLFLNGVPVRFGTDLLFAATDFEGLTIGVEICEDLWAPVPPSSFQALAGATVLLNLSASNELIGKGDYRRQLILNQSGRCVAAYAYASCGVHESTTDVVYGGHCLVSESQIPLAENRRFERDGALVYADVDLQRLRNDRVILSWFGEAHQPRREFERIPFCLQKKEAVRPLARPVPAHPFVPDRRDQLDERCREIFHCQVAGLAKRLDHLNKPDVVIGVSGGLDSTLALVVACKTMDALGVSREKIHAFTMPGFGTTARTKDNAWTLMKLLGVQAREIDIRPLCLAEMQACGFRPFGIDVQNLTVAEFTRRLEEIHADERDDLTFENIQARMRMHILMNHGFVIGTGDVSELALGWCTYNGDHMSMYNPNVSIPKTLVKFLVSWAAENEFDGAVRKTMLDVVATEISPELLPAGADGQSRQSTEKAIGPYELHDFFLYHFLRYGASPAKILFLAEHAKFERDYSPAEIRRWLATFLRRFFANQFKRSCLPDGPKVGTISLSPRADWRMPSDAEVHSWLKEID